MGSYIKRERDTMLRHALQKLQQKTPVTSIGPGAVARSLAEVMIEELGNFNSILDYNTSMGLISTAQGRALDLIGELYNVQRKQLGEIATIDSHLSAFYFYLDAPHSEDVPIPINTTVSTDDDSFIGESFVYVTTRDTVIPAGRTRTFVEIRPVFNDSIFTAGANTITRHNVSTPTGVVLRCTNPKPIAPQEGFETDNNFRSRIIKEVRRSAGGTSEAIRFAALSVRGVRDVKVREAPYGLGSCEALLVPEDRAVGAQLVTEVFDALEMVRPSGVRLFAREPDYLQCVIEANIIIREGVNVDPQGSARKAEIGILRFLNTLLPGQKLIYTKLIQAILDSTDAIADVSISSFQLGNQEIARNNYTPQDDEQIVPGRIEVRAT